MVVFPEGTRSVTGEIIRFHKGAFQLAQALNVDILPVFIHGAHDVMPKNDFVLREGKLHVEIGQRMLANEVNSMETNALRTHFHEFYIKHLEEIRKEREDVDYVLPFVKYKYIYKGNDVEQAVMVSLKKFKAHSKEFNALNYNSIAITNSGYGELAWTIALLHQDTQIYAFEADEDKFLIATHTSYIPENLHFLKDGKELEKCDYIIDCQSFLR